VILFNASRRKLVLVKQFRPAVYYAGVKRRRGEAAAPGETLDVEGVPAAEGVTVELCAGIMDKPGLSPAGHAVEEALEECGYKIGEDRLERVTSCLASVGVGGENLHMFYARVLDEDRISAGGGVDGELIEVLEMDVEEARAYIRRERVNSTPTTLYGLTWFLLNKADGQLQPRVDDS